MPLELTFGIHPLTIEAIKRALPAGKANTAQAAARSRNNWERRVNHIRQSRCSCCFSKSHDASTCPYRERD